MRVPHTAKERHVARYLMAVLIARAAELEVNYYRLPAIRHHPVGAVLGGCVCRRVVLENGALVEELPTRREPVAHLCRLEGLPDAVGQLGY